MIAGIKNIEISEKDPLAAFDRLLNNPAIGLIVTDNYTLEKLDNDKKQKIQDSIDPMVLVLSGSSEGQDNIREKIKQSIGVDVWNR